MEVGLTRKLRPAGVRKVEIGVDAKLEDEDDTEDGASAAEADGRGAERGGAADGGESEPPADDGALGASAPGSADAGPDMDASAGVGAPGAVGRGATGAQADPASNDLDGGAGGDGAPDVPEADAGIGAAPGKVAMAQRLAGLVRRMASILPGNPPGAAGMRAAAMAGQAAVRSGDLAGAGQAADTLERLLGGADGKPGGNQASADPAAPEGVAGADRSGDETGSILPPADLASAAGGSGNRPAGAANGWVAAASEALEPAGSVQAAPASASAQTGSARRDGSARVFAKGCQAWRATRAKVESDIEAVIKKVAGDHGPGGDEADVVRKAFGPLIHKLDDRLAAKLDEAAKAGDSAMHDKLARDAQGIIQEYKAFIDASPLVAQLDQNPYHRVSVQRTLDTALAALSRAVGIKAGPDGAGGRT